MGLESAPTLKTSTRLCLGNHQRYNDVGCIECSALVHMACFGLSTSGRFMMLQHQCIAIDFEPEAAEKHATLGFG
jgi:hypothetical protein